MHEKLAIAGGGAIACGLAATAAYHGPVTMLVRSEESADRARATVHKVVSRMDDVDESHVHVTTDIAEITGATAVIEAIAENLEAKIPLLKTLAEATGPDVLLGSTTSSLSVEELAAGSGVAERFVGLHVFNPVPRMKLVELIFPGAASDDIRRRAHTLCEDLDKTPVEIPDTPGFIVNRLLFPYLFDAVRHMEATGLTPEAIDTAMTLGAGHPMGPIALLDFIGLDVSVAIAEQIGTAVPESARTLIAEGALGKKSGRGYYTYTK